MLVLQDMLVEEGEIAFSRVPVVAQQRRCFTRRNVRAEALQNFFSPDTCLIASVFA